MTEQLRLGEGRWRIRIWATGSRWPWSRWMWEADFHYGIGISYMSKAPGANPKLGPPGLGCAKTRDEALAKGKAFMTACREYRASIPPGLEVEYA